MDLAFLIPSVSIYYGTQSGIRVKSYYRLNLLESSIFYFEYLDILWDLIGHPRTIYSHLNLLGSSVFNFEHIDILRDSIKHPSIKLFSFEFHGSSNFNFERLDILRDSIRYWS